MIKQISGIIHFKNIELDKRLHECIERRSCKTSFYKIVFLDQVVGYIALDRWPEPEVSKLVIYELFIESNFRREGYGVKTIENVEAIAKKEEYKYISLAPCQIDSEFPFQRILNFYKKCGFIESQVPNHLIKKIIS